MSHRLSVWQPLPPLGLLSHRQWRRGSSMEGGQRTLCGSTFVCLYTLVNGTFIEMCHVGFFALFGIYGINAIIARFSEAPSLVALATLSSDHPMFSAA